MKKIITAALALVLLCCLGLAACGPKESKGGGDILWISHNDSSYEHTIHKKLGDAFAAKMEKEGKTVTVKRSTFDESKYGEGISKLQGQETLGDVIFTYDTYASQYIKEGIFADLDAYIERDGVDLALYNEDIIGSARAYENKLAYFPRSFDQVTIFINYDFFEDLNMTDRIPQPKNGSWDWWTWSELLDLCADLRTAIDAKYTSAQASYIYPMDANLSWDAVYDPVIKSFGGYTVDGANKKSGFDSANTEAYGKTVKALDFMKGLITAKYTPTSAGKFTEGKIGMAFQTRPSVAGCMDEEIDLRFAPVPVFDDAIDGIAADAESFVGYGSAGYALNAQSDKKDLAWEYIKFIVSEEGQKIVAQEGLCIPTIKSQLTTDGEWTKCLEGVDQSAFLYSGNTLSLAKYARGVDTATEYQIYSNVKNNFFNQLSDKSAAETANYLYNQIKQYIR